MKLKDWLDGLEYELAGGSLDAEVREVSYDSRKAKAGDVFVCMAGSRVDSHRFIPQVLKAGVRVIAAERDIEEEMAASGLSEEERGAVTVLRVKDGRRALALLSAARFGYPARKLVLIGVTGTKGKTTTTHMIREILEAAGKKTGLIGTTGIVIGEETTPTQNTTPESYELHQAFAKMVEAGCEYAVMEVSSQSVKMRRVDGIYFDFGLFTNITPDHIGPDEHKDFAEYLACKTRLLSSCRQGLVNRGDSHFEEIVKNATCKLYTYEVLKETDTGRMSGEHPDFCASHIAYVSAPKFVGRHPRIFQCGKCPGGHRDGGPFGSGCVVCGGRSYGAHSGQRAHGDCPQVASDDGAGRLCSQRGEHGEPFSHPAPVFSQTPGMRVWLRRQPLQGPKVFYGRERRPHGRFVHPDGGQFPV